MWSILRQIRSSRNLKTVPGKIRRLFMTDSFSCNEVWATRLKSPILQKVSVEDLFYELDNKFNQTGKVSAIDVDIFVNAIRNGEQLEEMEDLVHKLRLSSESSNMLESTSHAFIRNYLDFGDINELMRVLNDRLNYGIFPDAFCSILLLNYFIKNGDFCNAAKVAILHMLQEDVSNELIKYMSLYSCHNYLLNPTTWEEKEEVEEEEKDDEEKRVRVNFIRNPFFDDHFDLRDPEQLLGKTLLMLSDTLDEHHGRNYRILGKILRKDGTTADYLNGLIKNGETLFPDVINLAEKIIERLQKSSGESNENNYDFESLRKGLTLLKEGKSQSSQDVLQLVAEKIKSLAAAEEKVLISQQIEIYEQWENKREVALKNELESLKKKSLLEEVKAKKEELKRKEDELFFFEREDELDLKIENKKVRYPPKWLGKKKKKRSAQEDYVPPEITKQRVNS